MVDEKASESRTIFRFSLRSMIVVISVAILALSHGLSSYRLYRSEKELAKLRRETGYLEISDPTKIHVVAVPVMDSRTQRWRVYLPPGARYWLACHANDIPVRGVPDRGGSSTLEPGEWVVELRIDKDSSGKWSIKHHAQSDLGAGGGTEQLEGAAADWLNKGWVTMKQQAGTQKTDTFEVGEKVVLFRQRSDKTSVGTSDPPITQGVMLWLEP